MPALGESGEFALRLAAALADRYEVVREHRRGGMATVYLAVDRKHDRQVALKVLRADLAAGIGAERFLREIEIAAHLTHPHILPLLDSGLVDGLPYYVMPFVEEESLRERLSRVGPLPVDEALRIAHDVAEGLAHAHGNGVVHRDVKPGNVMLTGESAVVTDFGIAVAMDEAAQHLTRTGHSVGTAGYMSPEQASGDHDVDSRTDQYSLACVLFEMLTGDPPYTGRHARAILGRQLSQPVPAVSALRDSVPEGLDEVLRRALARTPADRYPTMRDFADALENMAHRSAIGGAPAPLHTRPAVWAVTATALLLVAAGAWLVPGLGQPGAGASTEARTDPTHYAIFPFDYTAGADILFAESFLHDALARWDDVSVVDGFEVGDAVQRTGQSALLVAEAAEVARGKRAGRFIMGQVSPVGDSLRVLARLYEVGPDGHEQIGSSEVIRLPGSLDGAEAKFGELAAELVFHGNPPDDARTGVSTRSLQALQAFQYGEQAVRGWQLARADSGFWQATRHDPFYARAHLWLALVRAWAEAAPSKWTLHTHQAVLHVDRLPKRDAAMAEAIWLQAEGQTGEACRNWNALTRSYANDFAVWFGLAHCLNRDSIVVPDASSPSGWSFRSSRHRALKAYEEAFKKLPSILEDVHSESYRSVRRIFLEASGTTLRRGRAEWPDTTVFLAYPGWQGDTLAHVPFLRSEGVWREPTTQQALLQLREMWLEWTATAVAAAPMSARARESLAHAMMLAGEPAALDTLLAARKLARTDHERFDLARSEVWMRLTLALPGDPAELERARVLADSLLLHATDALASHPHAAAGIAALVGRAHEAARYARRMPADQRSALPHRTQADANALLVFAALGGPVDSIARLEQEVEGVIRRLNDGSVQRGERGRWLVRPATLAFPDHRFRTEAELAFDWVVSAQRALADGDTVTVRESLATAEVSKQTQFPFVRTFDAQLAEMRLLIGLGNLTGAAAWVDPSLAALPEVDLGRLSRAEGIGPLIRIAALRADVAAGLGNHEEARRWARVVLTLWSDGDPFLQPLIDRLRRLSD